MAVTFDKNFFEWLERHDLSDETNLKIAIHKSIAIKADVVQAIKKSFYQTLLPF
jgi:3-dehydroquinate synthase